MSQAAAKSIDDYLADGHTPMMAQYMSVKAEHPDCLLFYRMGDFYELFFEDAIKASAVLDITLTKRSKNQGEDIAMCGVPFHAYEPYLAKLIRSGFKVALCEQTETPEEAKKRGGYKALVTRQVVRVITPGTLTEDNLLDARDNNYLASISDVAGQYAVSWVDLSTGEFHVQPVPQDGLENALERLRASEVLICDRIVKDEALWQSLTAFKPYFTIQPQSLFDSENARIRLQNLFGVGTLESFGAFSRAEVSAAGALIDYIERTQKGERPHLQRLSQVTASDVMEIDPSTRRNLELTRTQTGDRRGSLLASIDRTRTSPGARLLQARLSAPSRSLNIIHKRHDEIQAFIEDQSLANTIRDILTSTPDMERALTRLAMNRGGPRDLGALRDGLIKADAIRAQILSKPAGALADICESLKDSDDVTAFRETLTAALDDSLPMFSRDGDFIRVGYSPVLDELKTLRDASRGMIAQLQAKYVTDTGIDSLKISYNNILGYFIEVPAKRADKLMVLPGADKPADNPFIHRQTMASAVRFTTPDLADLERKISHAAEKYLAIEEDLFREFVSTMRSLAADISHIAQGLAALDVASSMADLAVDLNYTRPVIDNSLTFHIQGGRHPVVELALRQSSENFVPNDSDLTGAKRLWLLTGPNMAGKSTFLRQNALIAIMAQAGFYVPAQAASIGVIDKTFSRVGAADDLARGRSTFMMEMVETATILNQATEHSLVILDEIGRGTATYDGLSIAWACLEFLHDKIKCRGLFATHYHELTSLQSKLGNLSCNTMQVKEWKGDVIFLHAVAEGTADRSYGIHVAKLAGIPAIVTARAQQVLEKLQTSEQSGTLAKLSNDLPLFNLQAPPPVQTKTSPALDKLKTINPDTLSPKDALDVLYALKALSDDSSQTR